MGNFYGEYESKLDPKGRLVLPSKVKAQLPENVAQSIVISKGFEPCLTIYSLVEWNKILAKISALSEFDIEQRNLQRNLISRSSEVDIDSIGRFLIPKKMQEYASLKNEVKILGVGNKIELWDADVYDQFLIKDNEQLSALAQKHLSNPQS